MNKSDGIIFSYYREGDMELTMSFEVDISFNEYIIK